MDENMPQGGAPQPQPAPQDQPAPPPPENMGGSMEKPSKGMPKWVLLLGAVIVVVVLLAFVL